MDIDIYIIRIYLCIYSLKLPRGRHSLSASKEKIENGIFCETQISNTLEIIVQEILYGRRSRETLHLRYVS